MPAGGGDFQDAAAGLFLFYSGLLGWPVHIVTQLYPPHSRVTVWRQFKHFI